MNRRDTLKMLGLATLASGFTWSERDVRDATAHVTAGRAATTDFSPQFFTAHEYETVRVLVDLIIPRDERSGSATDVGVPEFMDFMMIDQPQRQTAMRGGLAWLDFQFRKRFGVPFVKGTEAQQKEMLDEIAWPERAKPEMSQGVAFFNSFRDLTASGFWSSQVGVEDIQFMGNTHVHEWKGCPDDVLHKLGVSYDD